MPHKFDTIDQNKHHDEYFTLWLTNLEKALDERWTVQGQSVQSALVSMDKRLDSMNEFRAALRDREAFTVTKSEFQASVTAMQKEVTDLRLLLSASFSKDEHTAYMQTVDAKLQPLRDFKLTIDAKASQATANIAMAFAVLGALTGIVGLIITLIKFASV